VGAPADGLLARSVGRHGRRQASLAQRGVCGEVARRPFQEPHKAAEADVAVGEEHGVLRAVMLAREAQRVGRGVGAQPLLRAEDVVAEGVAAEDDVLKLVVNQLRGRVVVALYFVADDLNLLVYFRLRVRAVQHDVGQQVNGARQVLPEQRRVEHGVLLVGEGVQVAAHSLEAVEYLQRVAARRALERDMLAEVGQPLLARQLVARAGAQGEAAIHHGRRRGEVDYAQPVAQSMCVVFHIPRRKIKCFSRV